jgi:hypothetical protein
MKGLEGVCVLCVCVCVCVCVSVGGTKLCHVAYHIIVNLCNFISRILTDTYNRVNTLQMCYY